MDSCSGEARVANRKGKLLVFFEWNLALSFQGKYFDIFGIFIILFCLTGFVATSEKLIQGKLLLNNFTEDPEELDISVTLDSFGNDREALVLGSLFKGSFRVKISSLLEDYISNLKKEYGVSSTIPSAKSEIIVKSKTVINKSTKHESVQPKSIQPRKQSKKKSTKNSKNHKISDDLLFFISLVSIVGIGVVIAVKIVNKL